MKGSLFSSTHSSPSHTSHHHHHRSYASPSSTPPHAHHHTFSETIIDENFEYAEQIVTKWGLDSHKHDTKFTPLFADGNRQEARRFLQAVNSLQNAMHYYIKLSTSTSERLVRAHKLMRIAINRLEKEFYVILSANRKNLDSETVSSHSSRTSTTISDFDNDIEVVSEEEESTTPSRTPCRTPPRTPPRGRDSIASDVAMDDLKSIADCMIASGYAKECVNIYKLIRKSIVDETMYYLGVEKLNHSQMQKMDWKVLEPKIKTWLHAVKITIKTLFCGERILCDFVFSSSEKIAESCFTEISKDAALNLFSFPENFGKSKKNLSPEKMFRALDLYEAISDLWPEIESIFGYDSLSAVRSEAVAALVKLGEAVRTMLSQFEAAIQKDTSKTPSNGGVHPLTRYVMNFLIFIGDYCGAVSDILGDWTVTAQTPLPESYFSSPTSGGGEDPSAAAITNRIAWLILVLLCKLDGKAVLYNDVALSYLFLANNLNYVVSKVRNSSLGLLMGPDWIWNNRSKVNGYLAKYERMGWNEVISSLPQNPTAEIPPQEVKERFRRFNLGFEEAYKKQTSWVIPDPKLRDEVKITLAKNIVPGYRVFYEKHRGNYAREIEEPIVRYAPEDLDNYLSDLFFPAAGDSRTSSYMTSLESSRGH